MVTMQYQAQTDMVSMIERLERACIRFVHFSKENEVRSRVFSEKMGIESGWNCHISLSDDHSNVTSPRSQSHDFNGVAVSNGGINADDEGAIESELNRLLPPLTYVIAKVSIIFDSYLNDTSFLFSVDWNRPKT